MTTTTLLPHKQSRWLLATGFAVLAAASFGEAVYAFQTASQAQTVELAGFRLPFDATVKTVIAIGAGIFGALGLPVSIALWRRDAKKWQNQARLGFILAAVAVMISIGNLSGYFAFTRSQANAENASASPVYTEAMAKVQRGEQLMRYEAEAIRETLKTVSPEREFGDVLKAALVYGLIVACGAAYTLPKERQIRRRRRKAVKAQPKAKRAKRNPRKAHQPELVFNRDAA